jgi:hypothetical protein
MYKFQVIEDKRLLIINCPAELDFAYASSILTKIYFEKDGKYSSYNSFVNLSLLEKNFLNMNAYMESMRVYLSMKPKDIPIRIAILVRPEFIDSISMVQKVTSEFNNISLLISTEKEECASFLNIGKDEMPDIGAVD